MLALTRRPRDEIVLTLPAGERITIDVVEVRGNPVKVGIDAPRAVQVVRGELVEPGGRAPQRRRKVMGR